MKHLIMTSVSVLALGIAGCSHYEGRNGQTRTETYVNHQTTAQEIAASSADAKVRRTVVLVTDEPRNEAEYRSSLAGPGLLALVTSQMAQAKATSPAVKMFADAEVAEQQGISRALKDMNTTMPLLNADQQIIVGKLKAAAKGREFDEAYMEGQIMNHKKLLMITENYLDNTDSRSNASLERSSQSLAKMSLPVIKRHLKTAIDLEDMID